MAIKADLTQLTALTDNLAVMETTMKNAKPLLKIAGDYMVDEEIPMVFREEGPGWKETVKMPNIIQKNKILTDSKRLQKSITRKYDDTHLYIGTDLNYAAPHQYSAELVPKNGKYLVIPQGKYDKRGFRLRDVPNTMLIKGKKAGTLIVVKKNQGRVNMKVNKNQGPDKAGKYNITKLEVVAILVKRVKIPERRFLTWSNRALIAIGNRWLEAILKKWINK